MRMRGGAEHMLVSMPRFSRGLLRILVVRARSVISIPMVMPVSGRASVLMVGVHREACTRCNCPVVMATGAKQHRRDREPLHREGKGQQTYQDDAQAIEHDVSLKQSLRQELRHEMPLLVVRL